MARRFDVLPFLIHGTGVFASEDLAPGTKIIEEKALWVVNDETAFRASFPAVYEVDAINSSRHISLNATEMRGNMFTSVGRSNPHVEGSDEWSHHIDTINHLCGGLTADEVEPEDPVEHQKMVSEKLRQILILNAYQIGQDPVKRVGVFKYGSRVNHSCAPNAERSTVTNADEELCSVVTAVAAIKKGDEILVSYIDPFTTTLKRQEELQSRWQFTCACRLCSRPQSEIDASDSRRVEMAMATTVLIECDEKQTYSTAVKVWKEPDAHAVAEGITDHTLLQFLHIALDAGRGMNNFPLETKLARRMLAVSIEFGFLPQAQQAFRDRIDESRRAAADAAAEINAYLADVQGGRRGSAWRRVVAGGLVYVAEDLVSE